MKRRSDKPDDWDALRAKIIGLGGQSIRKSYYPELQQRLVDLELFRTLLDQSLDAVFLARIPTGVLTDVNESACRQLGYSRDELLAMSFIDLLAPPESGQIGALLKRKAVLKHGVHVEVSLSKKRGGSIPVEMTLRLVEVRGSAYAVAVVRDMTERRKAGEALRESETMHRLLIDNATDMISRHMPDSTIIYTTPSCERMLGYRPEEMIGRMAGDFVAPGDMEGVWAAFRASREAGEDWYRAEFRMIRRDGATIWTETLGKIIRDEQGKVVEVHSVLRDITERKRAEDALHESEERYRMLFENAIEGIFRTTLDGRAIMCNSALARMLGYDSPQDAVLKLTDIGSQVYADIRERMAVIERLTLEGKVTGSEVLFKRSDGSTMKAMLNVRLVHDERGAPAFIEGSCIDITERWLAQEALKASEEKYRKIFEDATEGIFQTTPEGRYLSVNPAFALMFGFSSPQEMIESVHDIAQELYVNPADRREMVRMLREDDKVQVY
jgi:PAS domain S-box-containing protein